MWLANRIRDTWDEYAGKETRHARVRGRVRVSEASDCPIYPGMSGKLKAVHVWDKTEYAAGRRGRSTHKEEI